jgi:phage terminase large subunit-like protein
MVEQVLREIDPDVSYRAVHATRGKQARAEPVAALYEQGRVSHVGAFPELEDEMCSAIGEGSKSPDRLDALVWAIADLMLRRGAEPRVRVV